MRPLLCSFAGLLLVAACGERLPSGPAPVAEPEARALVDLDGDGFAAPDDCVDEGIRWASVGEPCEASSPPHFAPGDGQLAKDFSLVEAAGSYHIFHIRGSGPWGSGDNETTFGHESSLDLLQWQLHPPLDLRGAPGDWNDRNLWAPHVIRVKNQWRMYYTGVSYAEARADNLQRIGLSVSDDLFTWTPADVECDGVTGAGCLLDCDAIWSIWGSGGEYTGDCRDPFVMRWQNGYVMFLTARKTNYKEVIARAVSSDGLQWSLVDYLPVTESTKAESPTALVRNGQVQLYWSAPNGIVVSTSVDPLGSFGPPHHVFHGFAAELMPYPDDSYALPFVSGGWIYLQRLSWNASGQRRLDWNVSPLCWIHASSIHPGDSDPPNGVDDNCDGTADRVVKWVPPAEPERRSRTGLRFMEPERGSY